MSSPLIRRIPRQLVHNAGRYLGIFALIAVSIAFVSGFLVAASSIERIVADMPEDYRMQDGQFTCAFEAPDEAIEAVEELGVSVEEEFSREAEMTWEGTSGDDAADSVGSATVRLFKERDTFDLASYVDGEAPDTPEEVALDRVFCAHHDLTVGDTVQIGGSAFEISGICTLPDYSSLFEDPSDFVFNSITFTIGVATPEGFASVDAPLTYTYAYRADEAGLDRAEAADLLEDIATALRENGAMPTSLMDAASNSAISYAADDVEGDQLMWEVMLVLLIVIMAFVFVVLAGSSIEAESAIIGTLLASGYRKRELVAHYMALPALVGILAAVAGNLVGYQVLYAPMRDLYYNSYSLPPFEMFWNWRVFFMCTVVPVVLLVLVNLVGLMRKLRCTPLEFLRRETTKRSRRRGVALPERLPFTARFRLRILLCNLPSFLTLFCGIAFASLLLVFGLCMMPVVDHYAENLKSDMVAEHQYILKAPVEIDVDESERVAQAAAEKLSMTPPGELEAMDASELRQLAADASRVDPDSDVVWNTLANSDEAVAQAEKFAVASLETARPGDFGMEDVSMYGIQQDSAYWSDVDAAEGSVVVGRGLAEKCGLSIGGNVELSDPLSDETYELRIGGTCGSASNMNAYLPIAEFNRLFGNADGYFNGYASDMPLAIDALYVVSDLTPDAMDKIVAQLSDSMGSITGMLVVLAAIIYVVLMYLLTKTVIDRSARSISYMKVFGYRPREVNRLYIRSITITVVASLLLCLPVIALFLAGLVKLVFMGYNGNFEVVIPASQLVLEVCVGVVCYAAVAFLHVRHIRNVPLSIALKAQE
ncbi:FtsX-like permease family protein [Eggerthellaceae bacterium zg-893]|nr:FtsX-like permease family protein [Eggerthellaceae bacterium zg-893]